MRALAFALLLAAGGCAASPARFYTELTRPGALGAGSPVVNLGSPIGSVSKVWPLSDGNSGVAFDVNRADADAIRRDSVMVLRDDPGGASLDVMNANPSSPTASPGTQIDGASSQSDANSLVAARNLAAGVPAIAMMLSAPGTGGAAALNVSPSWLALQQQIAMLQSQLLIAGVNNAGFAAQQLQQLNHNAIALERQLVAAGHSAEAEQLRRQVNALANTLTTPPPALMAPGTASAPMGTTPPASASPPPPTGGTLEIPPKR
jgi:hypothetical protein